MQNNQRTRKLLRFLSISTWSDWQTGSSSLVSFSDVENKLLLLFYLTDGFFTFQQPLWRFKPYTSDWLWTLFPGRLWFHSWSSSADHRPDTSLIQRLDLNRPRCQQPCVTLLCFRATRGVLLNRSPVSIVCGDLGGRRGRSELQGCQLVHSSVW